MLVLSDHGFTSFDKGINLNTWLTERGYLRLLPGHQRCGEFLEGVDWKKTRAFALGLSGLYLNLRGREAQGIVASKEAPALRREIAARLLELRDGDLAEPPIRQVFELPRLYDGPFTERAPDLIVGYNKGYRASWETAKGTAGEAVIEPNRRHWKGDHCIDPRLVPGVLLSSHPMQIEGASLADLAPTILRLFGIPKPAHMTGRSLV